MREHKYKKGDFVLYPQEHCTCFRWSFGIYLRRENHIKTDYIHVLTNGLSFKDNQIKAYKGHKELLLATVVKENIIHKIF